ncbi:MAG: phage tail length tape measure protein [Bacteroidetes bacterium]|jgi:tape measure domain-containing protein|nr:phage tail length tape measure protein [Bacteroidota bacterium]
MNNNQNLGYNITLKDLFDKTMGKAINSTSKLDAKFDRLENKTKGLSNGLGKLGGVISGAFAVGGVVAFGNAVKDSLVNYEYFSAALKTLLKGDEYQAKALQSQLVSLAKTTPFSLNEVQDATKQLIAYGFQAGQVVDTMKTLGDVSAGIGQPIGEIAYLYGTLKTSGRVTLMDLRQFAGRGIPIYEALSKRLKVTTKDINKMVHDGKLGFKDIEGAFKDMTAEGGQFFDLMDAQSKTVGGRISNLGDAWEQLKVNIGKSQSGIIASTVSWASSMVENLTDTMVAANALDEALKKTNTSRASAGGFSRVAGRFGYNTKGREQEGEALAFQKMIEETKSLKDVKLNLTVLDVLKKENDARLKSSLGSNDPYVRQTGLDDYNVQASLLLETSKQLGGVARLFKAKPNETGVDGTDKTKASDSSLGTGIEASVARPQDLHINIEKLVEELNLYSQNVSEGTGWIKDEITKRLIEAVNDVNYINKQGKQ